MEGSKKRPLPALPAQVQGPKLCKFWSDDMIKVLLDTCIEEMKTTGRNGTSLHKKSWVRLGQFGASASVSAASGASTSGASAIREHVGALNDPLVDVDVAVDDDDDDDDGNSRAHKIHDEVRPKKKTKTSRVTMDDLMVDMQCALKHMVKTTDGPTTEQCYEKLKLVGLRSTDPVFLAVFNIFGQTRQMREAWMTLPS
ncbi:hypothetical protein Tco_1278667, partial [Tanacetum coccineum]